MRCYFPGKKCAALITDLVSDKFTTKFPADKWQIVVIGSFTPYSNGGGVGFAVAGVSKKMDAKPDTPSFVPGGRFIATTRILDRKLSPYDEIQKIEVVVRDAVEQMMGECDLSPTCDIHRP